MPSKRQHLHTELHHSQITIYLNQCFFIITKKMNAGNINLKYQILIYEKENFSNSSYL